MINERSMFSINKNLLVITNILNSKSSFFVMSAIRKIWISVL
jgi:hypothetical protein